MICYLSVVYLQYYFLQYIFLLMISGQSFIQHIAVEEEAIFNFPLDASL